MKTDDAEVTLRGFDPDDLSSIPGSPPSSFRAIGADRVMNPVVLGSKPKKEFVLEQLNTNCYFADELNEPKQGDLSSTPTK